MLLLKHPASLSKQKNSHCSGERWLWGRVVWVLTQTMSSATLPSPIPSLCSSAHSLGKNAWLLLGPQDCLPGQGSGAACIRIPSTPSIIFFSSRCFLSSEPGQSIHVHFLCSTRQEPHPSASRNFKIKITLE